jgi:hypothetical protein
MNAKNSSSDSKGMGKGVRATYVAALEALKAHDCISGYSIVGHEVNPEWKEGGIERAVQEVTTNPSPFGLNRRQRGGLILILPQKDREKADAVLFDRFKKRYGFVLVVFFLMLGMVNAQQTNPSLDAAGGVMIDELKTKAETGDVTAQYSLGSYYFGSSRS